MECCAGRRAPRTSSKPASPVTSFPGHEDLAAPRPTCRRFSPAPSRGLPLPRACWPPYLGRAGSAEHRRRERGRRWRRRPGSAGGTALERAPPAVQGQASIAATIMIGAGAALVSGVTELPLVGKQERSNAPEPPPRTGSDRPQAEPASPGAGPATTARQRSRPSPHVGNEIEARRGSGNGRGACERRAEAAGSRCDQAAVTRRGGACPHPRTANLPRAPLSRWGDRTHTADSPALSQPGRGARLAARPCERFRSTPRRFREPTQKRKPGSPPGHTTTPGLWATGLTTAAAARSPSTP